MFGVPKRKSVSEFPEVIDHKLSKELRLGWVLGPFDVPPPYCKYRVSAHGVVPEKAAGEFRMIHHLSYPEGSSVSYFIPTSFLLSIMLLFPRPSNVLSIPLIWFAWLRSISNPLFGSFLFH